jgi:hypothetical protein
MALYPLGEFQNPITSVPHRLLFDGWKSRLEVLELQAIDAEFDHLVGMHTGSEIRTPRWLPCDVSPFGHHDWVDSAFKRIRDKACEDDRARTCWCFAGFSGST